MLQEEKSNHQSYQLSTFQAIIMTGLLKHDYWYNNGTNVIGVTNYVLVGFKSHFTKWLEPVSGQEPVGNHVIGPRTESIIIIIRLNWQSVQLTPNGSLLYP